MHPVWKVKVYNKMNKCDLQRIVERPTRAWEKTLPGRYF